VDSLLFSFLAVPLGVYLALCLLPKGRPAVFGCLGVVLVSLIVLIVAGQTVLAAHAAFAVAAAVLAGAVQILRPRLIRDGPRGAYPLAVGLGFAGFGFMIVRLLGM
jgi:hypothetical protein